MSSERVVREVRKKLKGVSQTEEWFRLYLVQQISRHYPKNNCCLKVVILKLVSTFDIFISLNKGCRMKY